MVLGSLGVVFFLGWVCVVVVVTLLRFFGLGWFARTGCVLAGGRFIFRSRGCGSGRIWDAIGWSYGEKIEVCS